jgi:hypothetical protein
LDSEVFLTRPADLVLGLGAKMVLCSTSPVRRVIVMSAQAFKHCDHRGKPLATSHFCRRCGCAFCSVA